MKKGYSITIILVVILLAWGVLHEGAAVILRHYDMQIRPWVQTVAAGIRYGLFLLLILMGIYLAVMWVKEGTSFWDKAGGSLGALAGMVFLAAAVYLGAVAFPLGYDKEHVGVYQNKKCVVREERWHHLSYYYYEYKGWFFMGDELLGAEQIPLE